MTERVEPRPDQRVIRLTRLRGTDGSTHFLRSPAGVSRDSVIVTEGSRGQNNSRREFDAGAGSGEFVRTPIEATGFHQTGVQLDPMLPAPHEPSSLGIRFSSEIQGPKTGATS